MNLEIIDEWLDNEFGVSYTRLEELHDFVIKQDLKHQEQKDKEIERLKAREQECIDKYLSMSKYANEMESKYIIEKYIVDELEKWLEDNWQQTQDIWYVKIINKLKELKEIRSKEESK